MNPFTQAIILLRLALGTSLGATPFVTSAIRVALVVGLAYSDPGQIWGTGQRWTQIANQIEVVKKELAQARAKVAPDWIAQDKDAFDSAAIQYEKELDDLKSYLSKVGDVLATVAAAYAAFAVLAMSIAAFLALCASAVLLSMATPAFPAVKGAAEAASSAVAFVAGAAAKTLTGVAGAASAILLAGVPVWLAANHLQPGGAEGADFKSIQIDYHAPRFDLNPNSNGFVAPKRNLPSLPD
jgi:uncharacterized protein YukE